MLGKWEKAVGIPRQPFAGRMADNNLFSGTGPPVASCTALCLSRRLDERAAGSALLRSVVRHFTQLEISCTGNSGPSGSCARKPLIVAASFSWLMEKLCFCFSYGIRAQGQDMDTFLSHPVLHPPCPLLLTV